MTTSCLFLPLSVFKYDRQLKAQNVNVKCYNAFNLINWQAKPITFVYSRLFPVREIQLMTR